VSARAASVPRTVATVAEITPTLIVTHAASRKPWFLNRELYHWVEKPPQTVTSFEALNEKMMRMTIGR